jgi:hypothetical protein
VNENYRKYYTAKLEGAKLYQDFVVDAAWDLLGLAIVQYSSQAYQNVVGESRTGVEIKHDEIFGKTGNLWIEISEKADPLNQNYVDSGIYRTDNTWLYAIGDYDTVFFFSKTLLRGLHRSGKWRVLENKTKTSNGFLLNAIDAQRYAAAVLRPNATEKINRAIKNVQALAELGRELHASVKANPDQSDLFEASEQERRWHEMWERPFDKPELL